MTVMLNRDDPLSTILTIDQAAAAAGVSRRTVDRWIANGQLPVRRIGQRAYVSERAALEAERTTHHARRTGRPGARPDTKPQVVAP